MTIGLAEARMPYVRFEEREHGLNNEASERAGRPIPRVVVFACVTPHGSKDSLDKIAEEWIPDIKKRAAQGTYPPEWAEHFAKQYEAWKKGQELPREGTPVMTWQAASAEQRARLRALGIPTVEDLAAVPDGALGQIGLDGRNLRDLAKGWINEAKDKGVNARLVADQATRIEDLEKQNQELRARLTALETAQERRGPGRPRKTESEAA